MVRRLAPVEDEPALEEPVARVLGVGLGDVEALDIGGVAAHPFAKELGVVVEIPVVKGEAELGVDLLEGRPALFEDRDLGHGTRLDPDLEAWSRGSG